MLQIGTDEAWLWVAVELMQYINKFLDLHLKTYEYVAAESLLRSLIMTYGKYIVYSDGGTWCPEACVSLGLKHRLHSSYEKNIVERQSNI